LLLRKGADHRLRNKEGVDALLLAMMESRLDVVFLLIDDNANINTSDKVIPNFL
jgi:ankyrin repeat protein